MSLLKNCQRFLGICLRANKRRMLLTDCLRLRCNYHQHRVSPYFGNGLDVDSHNSLYANSMALVDHFLCRARARVKSIQEYLRGKMSSLREEQLISPKPVDITDKPLSQFTPSYSQYPVSSWGFDSPGFQEVVHVCTWGITDVSGVGIALTAERRRSAINIDG